MSKNLSKIFYKNLFPTAVVNVPEGKKLNFFQKLQCLQLVKYKRYRDVPNVVSFLEWERARLQFAKNWDNLSWILYACGVAAVGLAINFYVIRRSIEKAEIKKFGAIQPMVYAFTPQMRDAQVANRILKEEKSVSIKEQIAYGWKLMNAGPMNPDQKIAQKEAIYGPRMPRVETEDPQESHDDGQ